MFTKQTQVVNVWNQSKKASIFYYKNNTSLIHLNKYQFHKKKCLYLFHKLISLAGSLAGDFILD